MPLFEFSCNACKKVFDEFMSIHVNADGKDIFTTPVCPSCGGYDTKKLISLSNFHLKGSGWAKDLYSKKEVKND